MRSSPPRPRTTRATSTFRPNARVERYLPHGPILRRAAAVISHGGMGTTQKALAAGVPVCAVPFMRDQFEVARRVEHCGGGTLLPAKRLRPDRLRSAVEGAIACREGAERVRDAFGRAGGAEAAASALEGLLAPERQATRRRAMKPTVDIDLYGDSVVEDSAAAFQRIRDAGPVVRLPRNRIWAMGRYEDVRAALRDEELFTSDHGVAANSLINLTGRKSILFSNGKTHAIRRQVQMRLPRRESARSNRRAPR